MSQTVSAREQILAAIRGAKPAPATDSTSTPRPTLQLTSPPDDPDTSIERFMSLAREEAATAERVAEAAELPVTPGYPESSGNPQPILIALPSQSLMMAIPLLPVVMPAWPRRVQS
jgi:hypothetical protein